MEKTISAYRIPYTEQWTMNSKDNGAEYRIFMYVPSEPAPAEGYPVTYLLDGNALFGSVVEANRLQTLGNGHVPAVVVGIGYPTDEPYDDAGRVRDYTVHVPGEELPPRDNGAPWPETGGADAFIQFIANQLKPEIEEKVYINLEKQGLLGHELGGFFTLYVLFNRPDLFNTYVIGSPSIWWKNHFIVTMEDTLYKKLRDWEETGDLQFKRLLIGVGAAEKSNIIEDARDLYNRLADWQLSNFEADLRIFLEEGPITMLPPLISRGLAYFFD